MLGWKAQKISSSDFGINFILFFSREKLQLEIAAREKAERKHQEYEERLKAMQAEMAKREQDLLDAQVSVWFMVFFCNEYNYNSKSLEVLERCE